MIRVKICGITNWADAKAASEAGADSLGLNFYEKSLRRISTADAAQIRNKLPKEVEAVGVFVNAAPTDVISLQSFVRFDAAQLHGDETPAIVSQVARSVLVIKALRVSPGFPLSIFDQFRDVAAFLLDAARAGQYGGTGQTTDWVFARRAAEGRNIILAGGLTPENVGDAIRAVRPYAVDVASGVETKPGKKDHGKVREFIEEVRRTEKDLDGSAGDHRRHEHDSASTNDSTGTLRTLRRPLRT